MISHEPGKWVVERAGAGDWMASYRNKAGWYPARLIRFFSTWTDAMNYVHRTAPHLLKHT